MPKICKPNKWIAFILLFSVWSGPSAAAAAGAAAAPTPTPLKLAYPAEGTILSAQVGLVFARTDILARHGFNAQVTAMGTGRELKTAMVSGRADVILTSQTNFVVLLGNGFEAYALGSLGSAGRLALVVRPDSPVQSLDDLRGGAVATIFGTSLHQPALEWLRAAGLEKEVRVADMGSHAAMNAALTTGAVRAIMTWDPFLTRGLNRREYRIIKQKEFDLITLGSKAFHADTAAAGRLDDATKEALVYLSTHKDLVNGWFSQSTKMDVKTIDQASRLNANYSIRRAENVDLSLSPRLRAQLDREAEFLHAQRALARRPKIEDYLR